MDHDLRDLIANLRISQLKSRYCRYVDFKDWESLRSLFADDATFVFPDSVVNGADQFIQRLRTLNTAADVHTVHHLHTPDITVTGDRTARAFWPLFDYSDKFWYHEQLREAHTAYSYYYEEYELADSDSWLITRWELHRLRVDVHPPDLFARPQHPASIERD